MTADIVLDVRHVTTAIPTANGTLYAADDISLQLKRGEVLGLVGESGCGKTTTGLSILRLLRSPAEVIEGEILFQGIDLLQLSEREMRRMRGNHLSMIFQNPLNSLNPTETVRMQIDEILSIHQSLSRKERTERIIELLNLVGIPAPKERQHSFPHELSGGMRQRVLIAIALACNPEVVIADEPTTALDLTVQAQILWLLQDLQRRLGLAMIYITHDLEVAASLCQRIAVMYAGEIVEIGRTDELFQRPRHPYTRALMRVVPSAHWSHKRVDAIPGRPPILIDLDQNACPYAPRCPLASEICLEEAPSLESVSGDKDGEWYVRCWHSDAGETVSDAVK
jgi:peptide/nickel transport system ATP-binding protein